MIVHLQDYQSLFDGEDATLAVQEALFTCAKHPGSTLKLGGGTLHFYPKYAMEKEYYISNNDYSNKSILFLLRNMSGVTIDGEGAELLCHGAVLPFVVDQSEHITIQNLSVDYPHPFFFQGRITAADEDFLEISYDPEEISLKASDEMLIFSSPADGWSIEKDRLLACEFEADTKSPSAFVPPYLAYFPNRRDDSFLSEMYRYLTPTLPLEGKLRLSGHLGQRHQVGNMWVCTFSNRENPGIFGNRSSDLTLQNVNLYHTASMGVVCQLCENVTMQNLNTIPRPGSGRYLSVNADSTHFVHCTGAIRYESCTFTNMLDDAGNVHGNYTRFIKLLNPRAILTAFGHYQQKGINLYDPGDNIHVVDNRTMQPVATLTVKSSLLLSSQWIRLETEESFPEMKEGYVIENFTKMPELYICNCVCGHNRPRGFLPGTWRKTVISGNTFFNMMHGIHFTGDSNDWFESGPVENVLIQGNNFQNTAYTGGPAIAITPQVMEGEVPYHRNIVIENNRFELHEKRFLFASHVDGLVMRNNRFVENPSLPAHPAIGTEGVQAEHCSHLILESPAKN